LDLKQIYSGDWEKVDPSPVTKIYQSEVSDGIEDFLAWRRNYGITDESDTENDVPTITFTDDMGSMSELEVGVDDCAAHIPPQTWLPKTMTDSVASDVVDRNLISRNNPLA